jgi:hypothetical protein
MISDTPPHVVTWENEQILFAISRFLWATKQTILTTNDTYPCPAAQYKALLYVEEPTNAPLDGEMNNIYLRRGRDKCYS